MTIQYRTVDCFGNLYPIEKLLDRNGESTVEPCLCVAAIMMIAPGEWREVDPDIVPIYTVH